MVEVGRTSRTARQNECAQRLELSVEPIDGALEILYICIRYAGGSLARFRAILDVRGRKLPSEIEQGPLYRLEELAKVVLVDLGQHHPEEGIHLIDAAVGLDPRGVLGYATSAKE